MSSSSGSSSANRPVVIVQILPAGGGTRDPPRIAALCPALGPGCVHDNPFLQILGRFIKERKRELGKIQALLGVLLFFIGIVMGVQRDSLGVFSGIFVWGSFFYMIAGYLTVAAERTQEKGLANRSLGFNIVSTVTALTGIVLYSIDASGTFNSCRYCYGDGNMRYVSLSKGISGLLVIFSILEFAVCLSLSLFACRDICFSEPEEFSVGNHFPHNNTEIPADSSSPFQTYETLSCPKGFEGCNNPTSGQQRSDQPPQYSVGPISVPGNSLQYTVGPISVPGNSSQYSVGPISVPGNSSQYVVGPISVPGNSSQYTVGPISVPGNSSQYVVGPISVPGNSSQYTVGPISVPGNSSQYTVGPISITELPPQYTTFPTSQENQFSQPLPGSN